MNIVSESLLKFIKLELLEAQIKVSNKKRGRGGVDFLIGDNQLYLQSIDLDISQRSIKISKQDLGELNDNLFIALILVIDKGPKVIYLIPSEDLSQCESSIFIDK